MLNFISSLISDLRNEREDSARAWIRDEYVTVKTMENEINFSISYPHKNGISHNSTSWDLIREASQDLNARWESIEEIAVLHSISLDNWKI